jgi:beta-N-acetylhexosaminidase
VLTGSILGALSGPSCGPSSHEPDSLDIKIGQMLMVGFQGMSAPSSSAVARDIGTYHVGGIILFDYDVPSHKAERNISSPGQVSSLTGELQGHASIPLFIAIDQEGGKVNRLKPKYGFDPSLSQQMLGAIDNPDTTLFYARRTAATLAGIGCNVNFAPVLDVNINPDNPVIGKIERSFSPDPKTVLKHGLLVINAHHEKGILTAVKHFPGHGSSTRDSHEGFVDVSKTWNPAELEPFAGVINSGSCDMIMTAHIFNKRFDTANPATLSYNTITRLLRDSLRYNGVVVSDDMQMRAIADMYDFETALRLVIEAGVDVIVFANNTAVFDPDVTGRAFSTMKRLVQTGVVPQSRIDQSFQRIMKLKQKIRVRG